MELKDILNDCRVDGNSVYPPTYQLNRDDYEKLLKAMLGAGATKVKGKNFNFKFPVPAQTIVDAMKGGTVTNVKKEFQFFATPSALAEKLIDLADLQESDIIIEPSAGQGAIVDFIPKQFNNVFLFELNDINRAVLLQKGYHVAGEDFLAFRQGNFADKIIANPPFANNQDIEHVKHMYNTLKSGGKIVSIMSNHWRHSSGKKEDEFRSWLLMLDAEIVDIPAGAFKESGTAIPTCYVIIDKP